MIKEGKKSSRLTKSLLPQRYPLQLLEAILLPSAVDDGILEQRAFSAALMIVDGGVVPRPARAVAVVGGLQLPRVAPLAVHKPRVVVALVEVLEHRREDLGRLVGQGEAAALGHGAVGVVLLLVQQDVGEVGGTGEDVLVGGKDALVGADDEGDDGADAAASGDMSG